MTWHQWQAEYPILRKIRRLYLLARLIDEELHFCQATGLSLWLRRYEEVLDTKSLASWSVPLGAADSAAEAILTGMSRIKLLRNQLGQDEGLKSFRSRRLVQYP
jgi:hypothetical protein